MKIPTTIGISILSIPIALIILGYYMYASGNQPTVQIKNIKVVNQSDTSASITWETDVPTTSNIVFADQPNLKPNILQLAIDFLRKQVEETPSENSIKHQQDTRDTGSQKLRLTHFVTLNNLESNTKYFFFIRQGKNFYPQTAESFTTLRSSNNPTSDTSNLPTQSIIGSVINEQLQPVDDALVFLEVTGGSPLSSYVSTAGSFLLSLKDLRVNDSQSIVDLGFESDAKLIIITNGHRSEVLIRLPISETLPPIILGQNFDYRPYLNKTNSKKLSNRENILGTPENNNPYDLNQDGIVNDIDVAVILLNIGKELPNNTADLNKDGNIDQADIDLLKNNFTK